MDKHFDFGLYALSVFVIILSFFTVFVLTVSGAAAPA
jgi:hypothetical protein